MGPTGPHGLGTLLLADATGQTIGTYECCEGVLISIGNVPVFLNVNASGFLPNEGFFFSHDSADCSGPRYLPLPASLLVSTAETTDGKTAYYAQLGSTPVVFAAGSEEVIAQGSDPSQPGTCDGPISNPTPAPYTPPQSLDLTAFVPPFHLQ